jgi:hypothetical protein
MGLAAKAVAFEELREKLRSTALPDRQARLPSAIPAIDRLLGGGFSKGTLTTLEGPLSSGRWALASRLLAGVTRRGLAAIIDAGGLYPPALVAAGVALERLVIVPAGENIAIARAVDALLRSRACGVVAFDAPALRPEVWARLAGLAHKHGTLLLVVTVHASHELAGAAHVRVRFEHVNIGAVRLRVRHETVQVPCSP